MNCVFLNEVERFRNFKSLLHNKASSIENYPRRNELIDDFRQFLITTKPNEWDKYTIERIFYLIENDNSNVVIEIIANKIGILIFLKQYAEKIEESSPAYEKLNLKLIGMAEFMDKQLLKGALKTSLSLTVLQLSIQHILLGKIYPEIRAIKLGLKDNIIEVSMYLEREPTEEDINNLEDIENELLSYYWNYKINDTLISVKKTCIRSNEDFYFMVASSKEILVYQRKE